MGSGPVENLVLQLELVAAKNPGAPALLTAQGPLSYQHLLASAKKAGAALGAATSQPVVALYFPMSAEFVSAFFGTLYACRAVLPLNVLLAPEDLGFILNDAGADLVVTLAALKPRLEKLPVRVVTLEELAAAKGGDAKVPTLAAQGVGPQAPCTLLYTSGTTGRPKGVELTHRNLASDTAMAIASLELGPDCRMLACLPTFHTLAITATMLAPLFAGGAVVPYPKFDPEGILRTVAAQGCNTLVMVPSMYRLVTRWQERHALPLGHLKLAVAGGEPLPAEVRERFERVFGIPLLEGYGLTETSPVIAFNVPKAHRPGTVGKPLAGLEVKIMDPESLDARPAGEVGEIWTRGPHVMRGYRNRPEEMAKVMGPDGWLRTGDMGLLDADGYLKVTGRLREMIKVGGELVFPAEVEEALLKHPAVLEAGVAGVPDEKRGESVKAFVALQPGQQATADELLAHCRGLLPVYKVPRAIEFRTELPKGPTGKVVRRLLK